MQLHEAAEIILVSTIHLANEKLAEGWKLLAVSTTGKNGDLFPCYVLGQPAPMKDPLTGVNLGGMVSAVPMKD